MLATNPLPNYPEVTQNRQINHVDRDRASPHEKQAHSHGPSSERTEAHPPSQVDQLPTYCNTDQKAPHPHLAQASRSACQPASLPATVATVSGLVKNKQAAKTAKWKRPHVESDQLSQFRICSRYACGCGQSGGHRVSSTRSYAHLTSSVWIYTVTGKMLSKDRVWIKEKCQLHSLAHRQRYSVQCCYLDR